MTKKIRFTEEERKERAREISKENYEKNRDKILKQHRERYLKSKSEGKVRTYSHSHLNKPYIKKGWNPKSGENTRFKIGHKEEPEMREKRMKAIYKNLYKKPNKPEQILIDIVKRNDLPFNYVGNGQVVIDGFNPDFLSCNPKHIIEVFGDYWHNQPRLVERDKRRMQSYSRLGYKTLIIWEHELKFPFHAKQFCEKQIVDKINKFMEEKNNVANGS